MKVLHAHKAKITPEERENIKQINKKFSEYGLQILVEEKQTYSANEHFDIFIVFEEKQSTGRREKELPDPAQIRARMQRGETAEQIAEDLGVGRATVFRHLKKEEET